MVSIASAGTALRIAARILLRFTRAAFGTLARYSSTFLGAILAFARTRRLLTFTFFTRSSFPDDWRLRTVYLFPDDRRLSTDDCLSNRRGKPPGLRRRLQPRERLERALHSFIAPPKRRQRERHSGKHQPGINLQRQQH